MFACSKDQAQEDVNESKVTNGLIVARSKMKKLNRLSVIPKISSVNGVKHGSKSTENEQIKNLYRENLEIVNIETGLNLTYDEQEFNAMISMSDESSPNNGFLIPNETFNQNLELINQNGTHEIFHESQKILNKVYGVLDTTSVEVARFSWGCGIALASNFVATLGLGACVTGVGCPLAIAGKALALAGVAASCL